MKAKAAVTKTGGIPNMTSEVVAGAYKAGPQSPRDMGKTRSQVAYAGGGLYQAGQPAPRGMGKKGVKPAPL